MKKKEANKLWFDIYFSIAPLLFKVINEGNNYSVVFKPTNVKVNSIDEAKTLFENYKKKK